MTYIKPKLHFQNALRKAQEGHDGTVYAAGISAIPDADDPYKVHGTIIRSADAAAASFTGLDLEFDVTKNRYRVVQAAAAWLHSTDRLPAAQDSIGASVRHGSYLYQAGVNSILKIDLVTGLVVDVVDVAGGGYYGLAVSADGLYLYAVPYYYHQGSVHKISLSPFQLAKTIVVSAAADLRGCCAVGNYIYTVKRATPDSTVYRIATDDSVSSCTLTGNAYGVCVSGSDPYLYVGLENVASGQIVRVDLSIFLKKDVLTLTAGRNNVRVLRNNGTYLFAGLDGGMVEKITISSFTSAANCTIASAGAITGLAVGAIYVYAGDNSNPAQVQRITISSWATFGTVLPLATGERFLGSLDTDGSETNLYPALGTAPGILTRVTLGSWTEDTGYTTTLDHGTADIRDVIEYDGFYYACFYHLTKGIVLKLNREDLSVVAVRVHSTGIKFTRLDAYAGFIYVGGETANVYKLAASDLAESGSLGITYASARCMLAYNGFLYLGIQTTSSLVIRINLGLFSSSDVIIVGGAGTTDGVYAMKIVGTNLYAVIPSTGTKISKIELGTFTETTYIQLVTGDKGKSIEADATYLYIGCQAHIARVTLSGFAEYGTALGLVYDLTSTRTFLKFIYGYLVAVTGETLSPANVQFIDVAAWTLMATKDSTAGACKKAVFADGYLFLFSWDAEINATYIELFIPCAEDFTLFDRLQTADIGGAFTIRQGYSAVGESATRPMLYAADGFRSLRAKGQVNTEFKIRAHAPNLITDGGFESGVFSPNWTAGANWAIESAAELEGAYSAAWDLAASNHLQQSMTGKIKKGKTYRILFKAKSVGANPTSGAITVQAKQTTSNTDIDGDMTGTTPAITTTATWFTLDMTPDFETNDWYLKFLTDHTKANGATKVIIDEVYIYAKNTVNTLILGYHNLVGRAVTVNAWKLPPIRSTSGVDANNKTVIGNALTVATHDVFTSALTAAYDPVYEIVIAAAAGFTAELGEVYVGDYWQLPNFLQGPLDPYATNADGLRTMRFSVKNLPPALRKTTIEDLFEALRNNEAVWAVWDTDQPVLMESPRAARTAPFTPYLTDMDVELGERL